MQCDPKHRNLIILRTSEACNGWIDHDTNTTIIKSMHSILENENYVLTKLPPLFERLLQFEFEI